MIDNRILKIGKQLLLISVSIAGLYFFIIIFSYTIIYLNGMIKNNFGLSASKIFGLIFLLFPSLTMILKPILLLIGDYTGSWHKANIIYYSLISIITLIFGLKTFSII